MFPIRGGGRITAFGYAQAVICFEIRYNTPDGSCSSYVASEIMEDEQQMLIDIEQNIANLERSLGQANTSAANGKRGGSWQSPEKTSKRGFLQRGSSMSTAEKSPERKRWGISHTSMSLLRFRFLPHLSRQFILLRPSIFSNPTRSYKFETLHRCIAKITKCCSCGRYIHG